MEDNKLMRLKELHQIFGVPFPERFKGSKAQRKNAMKEYDKLLAEWKAEKALQWKAYMEKLLKELLYLEKAVEITSTRFWWELHSQEFIDDLRDTAEKARLNVSREILSSQGLQGVPRTYTHSECVEWIKRQLC